MDNYGMHVTASKLTLCSNSTIHVFCIQFEQENQLMYSELNSVADEVKQIEGKVVEISQLVDVFSEKILQQVTSYNPN